ncbi:putative Radical_SAM domain-containing protein [Vibrio chagasii]|nr:putative Radical_SAM domain-containing protein [Vibrio chagasii]
MSLYIQIVDFCNMSCGHCMMNCHNKRRGESMNHEVYAKSIQVAKRFDQPITIGGGEPTLHKHLFDFLDFTLGRFDIEMVYLITNGSNKSKSLKLLDYKERYESFDCQLSLDDYHDPISEDVIYAFEQEGSHAIRTVDPQHLIPMGGALENQMVSDENYSGGCKCTSLFIKPNGDLKICACEDADIVGNILDMDDEDFEALLDFCMDTEQEDSTDPCWSLISDNRKKLLKELVKPASEIQNAA